MKKNYEKLCLKYAEALKLYRETDMTQKAICEHCKVSVSGFRAFIYNYCREDLFKRNNVKVNKNHKLREKRGQSISAHEKYREAILACDSEDYIRYTVSQIAKYFEVSPSGLCNQLQMHFPEILERRRNARSLLGLKNHLQDSVIEKHEKMYKEAILLLSSTNITLKEAADKCNVSFTGLRQHLMFHHKDLVQKRFDIRESNKQNTQKGLKNGNNVLRLPMIDTVNKYSDALNFYISSNMSIPEIASKTNVSERGLSNYLNKWYPEIVSERKNYVSLIIEGKCDDEINPRFLKSTALKYREAIELVRNKNISVSEIARSLNLNADAFRLYLKKHYPDLATKKGMFTLPSGAKMSRPSYEKYKDAIVLYKNSNYSLRSVATRLGLQYNSFLYFMKRNFPDILRDKNKDV